MSGSGHPLPGSGEARHDEIPEHLEREKGRGDDPAAVVQPPGEAVAPDGETYPFDQVPEAPEPGDGAAGESGAIEADQAAHQDRGQSIAQAETDGR